MSFPARTGVRDHRHQWTLLLPLLTCAGLLSMPLLASPVESAPDGPASNPPAHSQSPATHGATLAATPLADAIMTAAAGQTDAASGENGDGSDAVRVPKNPTSYGLWAALPALVTILLAILFRQVVPALVVGVLIAAYMLVPCLPNDDAFSQAPSVVAGFRLAAERYLLGSVLDSSDGFGHMKIIMFTLVIGFMVGVIGKNGGTRGLVGIVAGSSNSPRRTALTTWLAGMFVFFDDYANTMIVGPTMRSVFDRVKLSRAKLAYIIDSTAAPVASIALIGTWIGAEIGYINTGLSSVAAAGAPAFLLNDQGNIMSGMQAFIQSIPYRFYPILALVLVFLVALTGRDFGPMKRAESKALSRLDPDPGVPGTSFDELLETKPRWWLGLLPIVVLVGATVAVLIATGYDGSSSASAMASSTESWWLKASNIISNGDSYLSIFYGAILSAFTAVILTMIARACSLSEVMEAGIDGMSRMFAAIIILILAWALSSVLQSLQLGQIVAGYLERAEFQAHWLPLVIFGAAAGISFATGTSWGTMGILCPLTVEIAARLAADMEPTVATNLFYASVGSVLAGAVFGDHCSPISDTTVLSSIAAGCKHEEHVWTQLPYALVAAVAAMGLGDVMCNVYHQPWYYGLGAGTGFLILFVFIVGRKPAPSFEYAGE